MSLAHTLWVLVGLLATGSLAVGPASVLTGRRGASGLDDLRAAARVDRGAEITDADLSGLPPPVERYLSRALAGRRACVDAVRLEQTGRLRQGDASTAWKPFSATQHVTVDPPGFRWDASVRVAPLVTLQIRDRFVDGDGTATVSLFGVVPLGGTETSRALNEAELLRYLAEAVWYPTALLPREGVRWESIDDRTASATVEYGDLSASLRFSFDDEDRVTEVYADERARRVDGGFEPTPWSGHWREYRRLEGLWVPTAGEVVWHLPDGDLHAWEGRVTDLAYDEW